MSKLPNGWALAKIEDIATSPASISYGVLRPGIYSDHGIPMLRVKDINKNRVDDSEIFKITTELDKEYARTKLRGGELVISIQGTVGRVAIVPVELAGGNVSRTLAVVPILEKRMAPWVRAALLAPQGQELMAGEAGGSTRDSLNLGALRVLEIPVPPLPEQKRIADKLDSVLARVDVCRERLDHVPSILKRFRQSVLAAATSGRLTEDWREECVPTPYAGGQPSDYKSAASANEGAMRYEGIDKAWKIANQDCLPEGWRLTEIRDVIQDLRYGTSKKCDYDIDGTAVLRIPNIGDARNIDLSDLKYAQFDAIELNKLSLNQGDVLVIRSNGSVDLVGKCAVVGKESEGLLFAGYLMRLRFDLGRVLPDYAAFSISSPAVRQIIEMIAKSTSGVNNMNSEELRSLPLPLPSLDEQHEIVRRVETLFAFADRLEARLAAACNAAEKLAPSLLAKAFRGELVAQDPNDEPASELLRRLAESESQMAAGGKQTRKPKA